MRFQHECFAFLAQSSFYIDSIWFRHFAETRLENAIFAYLTCIRRPFRGFPSKYCYNIWCWKTRMVWLPDGENNWWYVYSFRQNTRKWQTDNARRHRPRLCVASRGNKTIRWTHHIFYVILHPRTRRLRAAARATTTMWPRLGCAATFLQRSCLHMLSWDFFNLIYVITKQKADICNSFQVIVRTETSANCIVYARVRDNYTTI